MCGSIKTIFNVEPTATDQDVHNAALQFVRKISGYHHPSQANEAAFHHAVDDIAASVKTLLTSLTTDAPPRAHSTHISTH